MLYINISDVVADFSLSRDQADSLGQQLVEQTIWSIYSDIASQAAMKLNKTRAIYLSGLNMPEIGRLRASIVLKGALQNMIEQGATAFDMKEGFKNSMKAKPTKNGGWMLTIPFRIGTPSSSGNHAGFSGKMGADVYKIAKSNRPRITQFGGGTMQTGRGMSMGQLVGTGNPKNIQKNVRAEIQERKGNLTAEQTAAYTHKTPLMQGMIRNEKTYDSATQGSYFTFRRVSSNSASNSWIHRGFVARDFFGEAARNPKLEDMQDAAIDNFLTQIGL